MPSYQDDVHQFEPRWRAYWAERQVFATPNPGDDNHDAAKPKYFVLDMFPYPSGSGLHVGHPLGYIGTDVFARFLRMRGYNVLHSMGFDAFGLPAEQYAIQTGQHPAVTTQNNIATMLSQLEAIGLAHDPGRRVSTADPAYYKWTQWIFLQLFHSFYDHTVTWSGPDGRQVRGRARPIHELGAMLRRGEWVLDADGTPRPKPADAPLQPGKFAGDELSRALDRARLAYLDERPVNWCPRLGTVLANEEVTADGRSERGNFPVFVRALRQWTLRITVYADRLIDDLSHLDWPASVVEMQRNWIGRSIGAEVVFNVLRPAPPRATTSVQLLERLDGDGEPRAEPDAEPADADGADAEPAAVAVATAVHPAEPTPREELPPVAVTVFTTRPDTLFGATYLVLSPEHPAVAEITAHDQAEAVRAYRELVRLKTDEQRTADAATGEKTGVFTGAYAVNPVNNEQIPVWISDYVLMEYGTGAIMAVPAHDERDFAFARKFELPIRAVVEPTAKWLAEQAVEFARRRAAGDERIDQSAGDAKRAAELREELVAQVAARFAEPAAEDIAALRAEYLEDAGRFPSAFTGDGVAANSRNDDITLDGRSTTDAKQAITAWLESAGLGRGKVQYKLRDWLFSRQRYWGEPFPVCYDESGRVHAMAESELPVLLPPLDDFTPRASDDPDGPVETPLTRAGEWMRFRGVPQPDGTVVVADGTNGIAQTYTRDPNTMPNWAGSCWYYLRYCDPNNDRQFISPQAERYWMAGSGQSAAGSGHAAPGATSPSPVPQSPVPVNAGGVDLYVGGTEHAVLHLLYARFWHKVLYDLGHVSTPEPFHKLFNQGMITADAYTDARGLYVPAAEVEAEPFLDEAGEPVPEAQVQRGATRTAAFHGRLDEATINTAKANGVTDDQLARHLGAVTTAHTANGRPVFRLHAGVPVSIEPGKMGKSLKNAVSPDEVIKQYSVDVFRLYEMYMGPLSDSKPWNARDIIGMQRFCNAVWRVAGADLQPGDGGAITRPPPNDDPELDRLVHRTIAKVTDDVAHLRMNTAIAALIELTNAMPKDGSARPDHVRALVKMLSPFAPHLAEELFSRLAPEEHTQARSVMFTPWPTFDPEKCVDTQVEVPITINGKRKSAVIVPADADDATIESAALADDAVQRSLAGKTPDRVIVARKGKTPLVNLVVKGA